MFRLLCLILTCGLAIGVPTLHKRDWSSHGIFDPVELQCSQGNLMVAHVGLVLTGHGPECQEYVTLQEQVTGELRQYCGEFGSPQSCDFKLADIIHQQPVPSCLTEYDVISICKN